MRSDWPIVAAAWLVTLLAATLLAAGPIYAEAVSLAGLRRVLADAPVADANLELSAQVRGDEFAAIDGVAHDLLRGVMGGVGGAVQRGGESDSYALPGQGEAVRDLVLLGFLDGVEEHASLTQGSWPQPAVEASAPLEVAVGDRVAETLGWTVGERLELANRRDPSRVVPIRVVGTYQPGDTQDPFWWDDQQLIAGLVESEQYRTFGPLLAARSDLFARAGGTLRVTWRGFPAFDGLRLADVGGLRARAGALDERAKVRLARHFPSSTTDLDAILADAQRSLLVSRSGVLLVIVQLAVLAAYAIVLTAGLLVDHRRIGTTLLRSRGAGPLQVAGMALGEALLLAVPAAVLGPWLAVAALGLLNLAGPLAALELAIRPVVTDSAYAAAGAAALGCALLLVVPAFSAARTFAAEEGGRSRFETRTIGQRLGLDLALLAVTGIGLWQLRLYGAPLTRSVQGSLGLDPLLVAAPAIGLLAGGVLALRLVPLLAAGADLLTRRGRALVTALGAQQVARRPLRYTRSALLLMLALSMGVFAISYSTTWQRSQADQAAYQIGADVRLEASTAVGNVPGWAMRRALGRVPGVAEAIPLSRETLRLSRGTLPGEVIGIDPDRAAGVVSIRNDLAGAPLGEVLAPLAAGRPRPALVTLPDDATQVRVRADVVLDGLTALTFDPGAGEFRRQPVDAAELAGRRVVGAQVVVRDGSGIAQRFLTAAIPYRPGSAELLIGLQPAAERTARAVADAGGGFTPPLEVLAIDLSIALPEGWSASQGHVRLVAADARADAGQRTWQALDLDAAGDWTVTVERNVTLRATASPDQVVGRELRLGAYGVTGVLEGAPAAQRPPLLSFSPAALDPLVDMVVPAIANQALLEATALEVGDELRARVGAASVRFAIARVVAAFPSAEPAAPLLMADLATLELVRFARLHEVRTPDEWWIAADEGQARAVAAALGGDPFADGRVTSIEQRTATLTADPVALGVIGALTLGFVVAGLFAVIGLSVSAAVSARQRQTEFALLRALGLSGGQLSGWLWLENAAIVLVSLVAGTGLGLIIGWVALPSVTVTQRATAPFPAPIVEVPWDGIAVLLAVSAAALAITVAVLGALLRRAGIGSVLRMGED